MTALTVILVVIAFFAGGAFGFLAAALCAVGRIADEEIRRMADQQIKRYEDEERRHEESEIAALGMEDES